MSPRSILKQSGSPSTSSSPSPSTKAVVYSSVLPYPYPSVHFPPTPTLAQTFPTHSGTAYDRAPIVVLPNSCALPERGCPGRTYDAAVETKNRIDESYFHPHALDACQTFDEQTPHDLSLRPPPLVHDLSSSESDESDGLVSPPPEFNTMTSMPLHLPNTAISLQASKAQLDKALAFLPHPPSPMKGRERKRRNPSLVDRQSKSERSADLFAAPSLEGCLGGF